MRITFPDCQPNQIRVEFSVPALQKYLSPGLALIATLNSAGEVDWLHLNDEPIFESQQLITSLDAFKLQANGLAGFEFVAPACPLFRKEKESRGTAELYLSLDQHLRS